MSGTEGWSRILHRKDERGVIVESQVFGPDDEIPGGFEAAQYQPVYEVREDTQAPVDEVNQKPWDSPIAKGTWVAEDNEAVQAAIAAEVLGESEPVDDGDELSEGSPRQAREDGDLTGAEEEVDESLEDDETEPEDGGDEVDEGTPRQAREDGDLTEAEEQQDEVGDTTSADVQPPPQGGPGSGKDAWAVYAAAKGVAVDESAGRDDIIAAVKKAGHPVD